MPHSPFFPDSFYRITIKGLCVRDGKIMLIHESKETMSDRWELPGGGLDFGEDMREALRREISEEMGLKIKKMSEKPVYVWTHRYEPNSREIGWYYSLVLAYRIEFEDLNFTPTDSCDKIEFFSKEQLQSATDLNGQTNELARIFNPDDFKEDFI